MHQLTSRRLSDGDPRRPVTRMTMQTTSGSRLIQQQSSSISTPPPTDEVHPVLHQAVLAPGDVRSLQDSDGGDKLFIQLLDDLDNISGASQSVHRRKKAREIFSEWLFSPDVHSRRQVSRIKTEQSTNRLSGDFTEFDLRRQGQQQGPSPPEEAEPFQRGHSARRSCGGMQELSALRRGTLRQMRPNSFHCPSEAEDEDDFGYHTGNSTVLAAVKKRPPPLLEKTLVQQDLKHRIETFNKNNHGLYLEMPKEDLTFQGIIRVHMNLTSPINMSISAQPPSSYLSRRFFSRDASSSSSVDEGQATMTTSFSLPKNTTKVIHISSTDTTQEVIKALLAKFSITDNPRKFVLFEKNESPGRKASMRKMRDDELPLPICLSWMHDGKVENLDYNKFVLQENDAGEILWKSFNVLELESFLNVLNREEEEHIDQVKTRYRKMKTELLKHLQRKQQMYRMEKKTPLFV